VQEKTPIREALEAITTIPTLPVVIEQITRLLQNPKTSAEEIGKAITTDQALASKVLKLVNSAFYGFPGKISTITHAIVILGFSTVKNVVLTASIFDAFRKQGTGIDDFDLEQFWLHSIACGAAAQSIAKFTGSNQKEECFIAGLIHDIGKIILCQYMPDKFRDAFLHAKEHGILFFESENELFDATHQEIGGFLASRWNLPKNLQNAVRYHHDPSPTREHYMMTAIVHCADIFVRSLGYGNGGDSKIPMISEHAWKSLGLEATPLNHLFESIHDDIEKAAVFIQFS
jgi:HD-like signal output (HDOD) protein